MAVLRFFLIVCCAVTLFPSHAVARPSSDLPLDSWAYPALEKLTGLGLIDSALQGSRPYARREAARQVAGARQSCEELDCPAVARELIARLEREFEAELDSEYPHPQRFVLLRELRVGYFYRDGEESSFPGTDAEQFALNTLNQGIEYREHHNLQAILQSELRLGDFLLLDWRPLVLAREGQGVSLRTLQGTAALGLGPFQLSAGRQSLWWGQGRRGTLLLSDNARPLDMVRLTNPLPARLPWIFGALGPFRFDLFVSRLEEERAVPEPWFGGLRVNLQPFSWLELGASRTVIFGGEGRPDVGLEDFLTIVGGENVGGAAESNQIAAIDARIRIPTLLGLEIYGELGGEDEADLGFIPFIAKKAFLAGLYLPRLEPSGRLGLRIEHADLSTRGEDFSVWYRHHTYRSGYVYEGNLLGHPVGGDGLETWGELRWYASPELTLAAGLALQRRGETRPVQEKHTIPSLEATWWATDAFSVTASYAYDHAENVGSVEGEDEEYHLGGVEVRAGW